ncbi:MAG: hypothetical protein DBX55_04315 [Verrucomicrobia bacterium]|nr:MAG: hypothetical protein DBX55_04315 [Verrucomicrobiota bacterium]
MRFFGVFRNFQFPKIFKWRIKGRHAATKHIKRKMPNTHERLRRRKRKKRRGNGGRGRAKEG